MGGGAKTGLYAVPLNPHDDHAAPDPQSVPSKPYTIVHVANQETEIKGVKYPLKVPDGSYVIRKLTVEECKRLQTVPDWYEFPVSDTQAYKMLGNGWTVDVIAHLLSYTV